MNPEQKERLLAETRENAERLNKLNTFMAGDAFPKLPREDKDLLYEQQRVMSQYVQILGKRLERAGQTFDHASPKPLVQDPLNLTLDQEESLIQHAKTGLTTDAADPRIKPYTGQEAPGPQNEAYLVLSDEERAKGFVRKVRQDYIHPKCGVVTHMGLALAETYARDPKFYGATYCCGCSAHFPVAEFLWEGTQEPVGS